ncbi:O-antigen ligase family protein [Dyella caseinilytica]|uniref:O-antigen ligase family protein n=1 Tax=Dyella caseinilytica TaxID=1849581 RepID=A0ABX7GUU4_9GAMM|nr:O-antigen ligase family protein [Dyella caseinilytica]QRN54186.1 O-antigen ligase family protein [Dyella caseinilytica]GFZ92180.1 membrane protein [Dyella caseinilytica]
MYPFIPALKDLLRSPLLPLWLVVALLPFGRSAELGTALCAIGFVLAWRRDGTAFWQDPGIRLLLLLLACYVGAALLSAFNAVMPGKSWSTVLALLRYLPLGAYACYVLCSEQRLHGFYVAVAIVIAFWVLDAWMQMLTGWSLRGHAEPERISGLFGADDPKLGPTLAVLSPFVLSVARERWQRRGLVIALLLLLGPVLLSGSRAAWLCFALVVLVFLWREAGSPMRFIAACLMAAVVLLAAGGIAWKTSSRFDARMQRTLEALGGHEQDLNEAMTGRLDIWHNSLAMIAAHPVTGVGVRDFRYAYPHFALANDHFMVAENCGDGVGACHAHQIVLEILTETGLVGLLLWLAGIGIAVRAWRRVSTRAQDAAFPVTLSLGVMLFPINTHLAFYSAWWGLLFAWLLGLWCAALYVVTRESHHGA